MFRNHLKIALRQIARNKVFSGINILGLSLGMALAVLIAVYVKSEHSYDSWMTESENTYRAYRIWGGDSKTVWSPPPLAKKMVADYPQVLAATGFSPNGEQLLKYAGNPFYIEETAQVDSTFFDVLGMRFLHGDRKTALDQPNSMVITDRLADKLFGTIQPVGQTVKYYGTDDYIITGVLDTKNKKSHIVADIFTHFTYGGDFWTGNNRFTYARLAPNTDVTALESRITADISELIRQEYLASNYTPTAEDIPDWGMQPLNQLYLGSDDYFTLGVQEGSMRNIYIFMLIGLLVLIVAIINYVNLTTARASQRSKEVGVKKVTGASKGLLTSQFITESVMQALVGGVLAILLAELALPFFNVVVDRNIGLLASQPIFVISIVLGISILVGLLAGLYPAFIMAAFQPAVALKTNFLKAGNNGLFRKILVTGQFAVTITLLIVMAFIYRQVNFMLEKDLGFKPQQVMTIPMNSSQSHRKVENLKARIEAIPGVEAVTTVSHFPGRFLPDWGLRIEGREDAVNPSVIFGDEDLANTLNFELTEGRFLDDNIGADSVSNFVVNETFIRRYNIEQPLGARIKFTSDSLYGQIVGVVKDFHFQGLRYNIRPLIMNARHWRDNAGIKLSTDKMEVTIKAVEQVWAQIEPNHPMRYSFLDEEFAEQYVEQKRFGKTILYATLLTLFIALLGLFGLTAFTVERRTREIGIRKVLGASVSGIIGLIAQDFVKLVLIASVVAIPLGYYLSNSWLQDFAHRTNLVWWVFVAAGLSILVIGFLIVCFQSIKAASMNPVESLRSE